MINKLKVYSVLVFLNLILVSSVTLFNADTLRSPASIENSCIDSLNSFSALHSSADSKVLQKIRYPKGFNNIPGAHIQYGLETEYLHSESEALLRAYMPAPFLWKKTKDDWLALSHKERLDFVLAHNQLIFGYRRQGSLQKIATDKELFDVLPDSFVDDVGHFEIVLDPVDSIEELAHKLKIINKHLGVGSMQAMISAPYMKNAATKSLQYEETLGYYNFMNDFDTLQKLADGYKRYLENPQLEVVKSFNHGYLGPMTKERHDVLKQRLANVLDGYSYNSRELINMGIALNSNKFVGGLAFRPDVAYKQGRLSSEVRDCHRSVACLENRIIRETYFLINGREVFAESQKLIPFDRDTAFRKGFDDLTEMDGALMEKIFQFQFISTVGNLAFPFRDWSEHVRFFGDPILEKKIEHAQHLYKTKIINSLRNELTSIEEKRKEIMGILAEFAVESGLAEAFNRRYQSLINEEEMKKLSTIKMIYNFHNIKESERGKRSRLVASVGSHPQILDKKKPRKLQGFFL